MDNLLIMGGTALWLGILTSISPCPMAMNIAAITFVGRRLGNAKLILATGALYTLGRSLAYSILAIPLIYGVLTIPGSANFLRSTFPKFLGPILILTGFVLIEILPLPNFGSIPTDKLQHQVERMGLYGSILLGLVFALAFCPVSAALFFGSLLPLAVESRSIVFLPVIYGIGTGLPVLGLAIPLALGAGWIGRALNHIAMFDYWARKATGIIFILIGIYESLRNIWGYNFFI